MNRSSTSDFFINFHDILKKLARQKAPELSNIPLDHIVLNLASAQYILNNIFLHKTDQIIQECAMVYLLNPKSSSYKHNINHYIDHNDLSSHLDNIDNEYNDEDNYDDINKLINNLRILTYAQLVLYKTLPCKLGNNCPNTPRELVTGNEFLDKELECLFYHHEKDRRRIPISVNIKEDFRYTGNYNKHNDISRADKFSYNYFESMYHPIYYKLFKCKRQSCQKSNFCPFWHHQLEKMIWDEIFQYYLFKNRDSLTKNKSKDYIVKNQVKNSNPFNIQNTCSLNMTNTQILMNGNIKDNYLYYSGLYSFPNHPINNNNKISNESDVVLPMKLSNNNNNNNGNNNSNSTVKRSFPFNDFDNFIQSKDIITNINNISFNGIDNLASSQNNKGGHYYHYPYEMKKLKMMKNIEECKYPEQHIFHKDFDERLAKLKINLIEVQNSMMVTMNQDKEK